MKIIFRSFLVALTPLIVIIGCGDDGTECVTECQNGGTCVDNTCQCPEGFIGSLCETVEAQPSDYIGEWIIDANSCNGGAGAGHVTISDVGSGGTGNHLFIPNLWSCDVPITVDGNNLVIPEYACYAGSWDNVVSGSGTLINGVLTITYTYDWGGDSEPAYTCTLTCSQ